MNVIDRSSLSSVLQDFHARVRASAPVKKLLARWDRTVELRAGEQSFFLRSKSGEMLPPTTEPPGAPDITISAEEDILRADRDVGGAGGLGGRREHLPRLRAEEERLLAGAQLHGAIPAGEELLHGSGGADSRVEVLKHARERAPVNDVHGSPPVPPPNLPPRFARGEGQGARLQNAHSRPMRSSRFRCPFRISDSSQRTWSSALVSASRRPGTISTSAQRSGYSCTARS